MSWRLSAAKRGFVLIPDHETAVDFLNYEAVAHTVVRLLKDNRQHALTLGIHGDWGAGKSSVLKMVDAAVRKARQPPAHRVVDDEFDEEIFREQRELVIKSYDSIRLLRLFLANHPRA